jgi:Fic family protein
MLTQDILQTSEIDGEKLDTEQVRSSLARHLGMDIGATVQADRSVEGLVEIILDATRNFDAPLTKERLCNWHQALFPPDKVGMRRMRVGGWRAKASGVMQVISGPIGREIVHYEAPTYDRLKQEMARFIEWFNAPSETDLVIQSALAHFWFVTIHPFEDGNGRIARAIADSVLARSEKSSHRFYSMSSQIQQERNAYYAVLESCQKGSLDITPWIEWYLNCLKHAIVASDVILQAVLTKAQFWAAHTGELFNQRQRTMINRLLDVEAFYGKLTSSKWAKLAKCSQDTALRDIADLVERQILVRDHAGGRSTSYHLRSINH